MHLGYLRGSTYISDIAIGGGSMPVLRKRTNPFWDRIGAELQHNRSQGGGVNAQAVQRLQQSVTNILRVVSDQLLTKEDFKRKIDPIGDTLYHNFGDTDEPMVDANDIKAPTLIRIDDARPLISVNESGDVKISGELALVKAMDRLTLASTESANKAGVQNESFSNAVVGAIQQVEGNLRQQLNRLSSNFTAENLEMMQTVRIDIEGIDTALKERKLSAVDTLKRLVQINQSLGDNFDELNTRLDETKQFHASHAKVLDALALRLSDSKTPADRSDAVATATAASSDDSVLLDKIADLARIFTQDNKAQLAEWKVGLAKMTVDAERRHTEQMQNTVKEKEVASARASKLLQTLKNARKDERAYLTKTGKASLKALEMSVAAVQSQLELNRLGDAEESIHQRAYAVWQTKELKQDIASSAEVTRRGMIQRINNRMKKYKNVIQQDLKMITDEARQFVLEQNQRLNAVNQVSFDHFTELNEHNNSRFGIVFDQLNGIASKVEYVETLAAREERVKHNAMLDRGLAAGIIAEQKRQAAMTAARAAAAQVVAARAAAAAQQGADDDAAMPGIDDDGDPRGQDVDFVGNRAQPIFNVDWNDGKFRAPVKPEPKLEPKLEPKSEPVQPVRPDQKSSDPNDFTADDVKLIGDNFNPPPLDPPVDDVAAAAANDATAVSLGDQLGLAVQAAQKRLSEIQTAAAQRQAAIVVGDDGVIFDGTGDDKKEERDAVLVLQAAQRAAEDAAIAERVGRHQRETEAFERQQHQADAANAADALQRRRQEEKEQERRQQETERIFRVKQEVLQVKQEQNEQETQRRLETERKEEEERQYLERVHRQNVQDQQTQIKVEHRADQKAQRLEAKPLKEDQADRVGLLAATKRKHEEPMSGISSRDSTGRVRKIQKFDPYYSGGQQSFLSWAFAGLFLSSRPAATPKPLAPHQQVYLRNGPQPPLIASDDHRIGSQCNFGGQGISV